MGGVGGVAGPEGGNAPERCWDQLAFLSEAGPAGARAWLRGPDVQSICVCGRPSSPSVSGASSVGVRSCDGSVELPVFEQEILCESLNY